MLLKTKEQRGQRELAIAARDAAQLELRRCQVSTTTEQEVDGLRHRMQSVMDELEKTKSALAETGAERDAAQSKLAELLSSETAAKEEARVAVTQIQAQVASLTSQLEQTERELSAKVALETRCAQLERQVEDYQRLVAESESKDQVIRSLQEEFASTSKVAGTDVDLEALNARYVALEEENKRYKAAMIQADEALQEAKVREQELMKVHCKILLLSFRA